MANEDDIDWNPLVEPDSPERCQYACHTGQCKYKRVEGKEHCKWHIPGLKKHNLKRYRLTQHFARVDDFYKDEEFKNLREETGILRLLLEKLLNQCQTPWDLMVYGNKIEGLVERIGKMVYLGHKLEVSLGQVLDKPTLMFFVDETIKIISQEVKDEQVLMAISKKLGDALERTSANAAAAAQQRSSSE